MPNYFFQDYNFKEVKFASTPVWFLKSATMCAKKTWKVRKKSNSSRCINSHYTVEKERKIIAVTTACLTYCKPQRAVFLQHKQPAQQPVCPIYLQLLTNPKRQVISSTQRTPSSSGGEEGRSHSSSFSSSFIWLVLPVVHSSTTLSTYELIWVWTWILWFSGSGSGPYEGCKDSKVSRETQHRTFHRRNISKCLVWHKVRCRGFCSPLLPMMYSLQQQCPNVNATVSMVM